MLLETRNTEKVFGALFKVRQELPPIVHNQRAFGKTTKGRTIDYTYTDLPTLLDIINPLFEKYGLLFDSMQSSEGDVIMRIIHTESMQHTGSIFKVFSFEKDYPQQRIAAITTAKRVFLYGKLGIHPAKDDDSNLHEGNDVKSSPGQYMKSHVDDTIEAIEKKTPTAIKVSKKTPRSDKEIEAITEAITAQDKRMLEMLTELVVEGKKHKTLEDFFRNENRDILIRKVNSLFVKIMQDDKKES